VHPVADGADHVPALYERGARVEAHGSSPVYERLALAVAGDDAAQALLARLEPARRQPNLLFGAMRWLGAAVTSPGSESGGGSASVDPRAGAPAPALLHQREAEWNGAGVDQDPTVRPA
jgi:hypothetical protein